MAAVTKITKCSFCRYIVFYAWRKQFQHVRPNRKLLTFPYVKSIRQVSTSSALFRRKRQDEEYESSSSSDSDSDKENNDFLGPRKGTTTQARKGTTTQARKGKETMRAREQQPDSKTGPKQKKTLFVTAEGEPLSRDQLDEAIVEAAKSVAHELEGDPVQTQGDLLKRIKHQAKVTMEQKMGKSPQPSEEPEDDRDMEDLLQSMVMSEKDEREEMPTRLREETDTLHGDTIAEPEPEHVPVAKKQIRKSDIQLGDLLQSMSPDKKVQKEETPLAHKEKSPASVPKHVATGKKKREKSGVQPTDFGDLLEGMEVDDVKEREKETRLYRERKALYTDEDMDSEDRIFADQWPFSRSTSHTRERKQTRERKPAREESTFLDDNWFILTGEYSGQGLNIFTPEDLETAKGQEDGNQLFDMLEDKEQKERCEFPVANAFEEQIRWTEEGKLWKFPIDNEQGWEEEASVSFEEHVFLEDLLEDFPKKGPVRHFMELVTTALSKNPYLTVAQKHEHIDWYRNYFEEKKAVIEESLVHAEEAKVLEQTNK